MRPWLALLLVGCGAAAPPTASTTDRTTDGTAPGACAPGDHASLSDDVEVTCLAPDVWVFTALAPSTFEMAGYPANGLLVESAEHSVMVDTGWAGAQAERVATFAERVRHHPVTAAVVTHFHDDRVGGAAALLARGVPVFAQNETAERAAATGSPFEHVALEPTSIPELTWMFPGAGHSPENIVVVHPPSHTLFGGCFVKSAEATDLGNVADADPTSWGPAIELVMASFPDLVHVVPGHGAPGDTRLLTHTLALADPPECSVDAECAVSIEALEPCACCNCVDPRALALTEIEALRSQIFSCEPVCVVECPVCTTPTELAALVARCVDGECVM